MPLNPSTEDHGTQVARVIQSTGSWYNIQDNNGAIHGG